MLQQIAPYFGYLASLFLIIALLVKTDVQFRVYNILGTIAFITYGIIFSAWPVLLTNGILFFINLYYLIKLYQHRENFDLIPFESNDLLTQKFIAFYKDDIATYFPEFTEQQLQGNINLVVLRDLVVANIFSAQLHENGDATVVLNYTIKKYRDFKVGKFIFEKRKQLLLQQGVKRVVYHQVHNKSHETFLKVTGFTQQGNGYVKVL
ncbi:YgjV family protein [Ferruginibacter yonginensis]|uniref:YgjV family protein n=1 Tax=Ferruginibacter yonginensis TaxID=1310416 RepID=A0ABV8QVP8_9BACT